MRSAIGNLYKFSNQFRNQFRNQEELTLHLFDKATQLFPEPIKRISGEHHSDSSTASSSGSPKPMLNLYSLSSGSTASTGFGTVAIENKTPSPIPPKQTTKKKYGDMCVMQ